MSEPIRTMQEFRARYLPNCKEPWPEDPEQAAQRIVDNAMRASAPRWTGRIPWR